MTLLSNRTKWILLTGFVCLFAAGTAAAQTNPATCTNDVDCVATPTCGGDVCDWNAHTSMKCKPAGLRKGGTAGARPTDDCKCKDIGATCVGVYCSFTRPCDAPGAAGCPTPAPAARPHRSGGTAGTGGGTGRHERRGRWAAAAACERPGQPWERPARRDRPARIVASPQAIAKRCRRLSRASTRPAAGRRQGDRCPGGGRCAHGWREPPPCEVPPVPVGGHKNN